MQLYFTVCCSSHVKLVVPFFLYVGETFSLSSISQRTDNVDFFRSLENLGEYHNFFRGNSTDTCKLLFNHPVSYFQSLLFRSHILFSLLGFTKRYNYPFRFLRIIEEWKKEITVVFI